MKYRTLFLGALFSVYLLGATEAQTVTWFADLGFDQVVPGTWAPLRVEVPAEAGPWTLEVQGQAASGRVDEAVVYSETGGGAFEEPLFLADGTRFLTLRFRSQGLLVQESTLDLTNRLFPGHVIGTVGLTVTDRAALSEVLLPQEPVRVFALPTDRWPQSPLSFGGLAALAVRDPGPVLAPVQLQALRVWLSSGGQMVITSPRPGQSSLAAQIGKVEGAGSLKVVEGERPAWKSLVSLAPYGEVQRWGTEFDPPAQGLGNKSSPLNTPAVTFLLLWGGLAALALVLRRKGSAGWPLAWSALGSVAVLGLWLTGGLSWDGGLPAHTREVVLPDSLGRFTSLEVTRQQTRSGFLDWSDSSPWLMTAWTKNSVNPAALVRVNTPDRVVFEAFEPPIDRSAQFRVHWQPGLRWSTFRDGAWSELETAPAGLEPDLAWLERLSRTAPGWIWSVGLSGTTVWVQPEQGGLP